MIQRAVKTLPQNTVNTITLASDATMASLIDIARKCSNALQDVARLQQIAAEAEARSPGNPNNAQAIYQAYMEPQFARGREKIAREASENGGRVEIPNLGRNMMMWTADE